MGLTDILTLGGWASAQRLTERHGTTPKESQGIEAVRRTRIRSGASNLGSPGRA